MTEIKMKMNMPAIWKHAIRQNWYHLLVEKIHRFLRESLQLNFNMVIMKEQLPNTTQLYIMRYMWSTATLWERKKFRARQ
jgi:hypothetical protein